MHTIEEEVLIDIYLYHNTNKIYTFQKLIA